VKTFLYIYISQNGIGHTKCAHAQLNAHCIICDRAPFTAAFAFEQDSRSDSEFGTSIPKDISKDSTPCSLAIVKSIQHNYSPSSPGACLSTIVANQTNTRKYMSRKKYAFFSDGPDSHIKTIHFSSIYSIYFGLYFLHALRTLLSLCATNTTFLMR
jgi:hypothetical protein